MKTRNELNELTVKELRKLAGEAGIGTGIWRAGATKERLVDCLVGEDVPEATATETQSNGSASMSEADQAAAILSIIRSNKPEAPAGITEDRVCELIAERLTPPTVKVSIADLPESEIPRQHFKFELPLICAANRIHCLLVGPAGTGKSHVAASIAEVLNLPFYALSVGPMTSKTDIVGFVDANGTYRDTLFVKAYQNGGVFLLDEMDAGNAGVLTLLNMATSNGHMSTPNGMIERHPDFVLIAAANTYGQGATRVYVGRNQLDGATLDRYAVIDWPADPGLEASFLGVEGASPRFNLSKGGQAAPSEWLKRCHDARAALEKLAIRMVVGSRAIKNGAQLLAAGVGLNHVEDLTLWKGCDADTRKKIETEIENANKA